MAGESRDALDLVWGRSRTTLVEKRKVFEFDANLVHWERRIYITPCRTPLICTSSPPISLLIRLDCK
jgi:hypothetical protein